ncbi:MAG: cell division protein FtsZ, partial [Sphingopyxis sp.]|nr:cell division protein FtsZ [Sphingopyxis sp.]
APARAAAPAPVAEEAIAPAVEETVVEETVEAVDTDPAPGFSLGGQAEPEAPAAVAEEEPMELSTVAATYDDTADELVLDAPEPAPEQRAAPVADAAPAAADSGRSIGGGTLFERMSRLSRGASTADDGDKEDGVDIPRFLGRQNNQ